MKTTITFRLDKKLKDEASRVFEAMGIDFSGAIKVFLNNVVNEGSLGFTPMTKDGLKFKYYQEYKKKLARTASLWKEVGSIDDPSIDWKD